MPACARLLAVLNRFFQRICLAARLGFSHCALGRATPPSTLLGQLFGHVLRDAEANTVAFLARVEHYAASRFSVPACTPGFLDKRLKASRHAVVDDKAHPRSVNAHAEGSCRDNNVEATS